MHGVWVAQLVKFPTLDFGSGHDLKVLRSSPVSGSALGGESARDSLSPSPSDPLSVPSPAFSLSNKYINKIFQKKKRRNDIGNVDSCIPIFLESVYPH